MDSSSLTPTLASQKKKKKLLSFHPVYFYSTRVAEMRSPVTVLCLKPCLVFIFWLIMCWIVMMISLLNQFSLPNFCSIWCQPATFCTLIFLFVSQMLLLTAREVALTQRSHQHPQGGEVGESTQSIGCNGFRVDLKKETVENSLKPTLTSVFSDTCHCFLSHM